jgi:hypothetical protein
MDGFTLERVLSSDPKTSQADYLKVLSLDELPKHPLDPKGTIAMVVNTDVQPRHSGGEHWVAIYGDGTQRTMEYFDPFGTEPFRYAIEQFFKQQGRPRTCNSQMLQNPDSSYCGYYCLYFLLMKCRGVRMWDITAPFTPRNFAQNDRLVKNFIHQRFAIPEIDELD